jgi:DMSO/TMAO reductase YedYZ molybdopterin-dependent catalytic subunit
VDDAPEIDGDDYGLEVSGLVTDKQSWTLARLRTLPQESQITRPLPAKYGFPMKLRVPTKLGFKNPKHVMALFVTNDYPGGYWEDQATTGSAGPDQR